MCRTLQSFLAGLTVFFFFQNAAGAALENSIETRFATIQYNDEDQLRDFLWRITGQRVALADSSDLVKNRVDELVGRVEAMLEMYPEGLHFFISFKALSTQGTVAEYSHATRTILVVLDRVTDGILAHEMAHAVMNAYFPVPPPEKAQEILAQYVDAHLYNL